MRRGYYRNHLEPLDGPFAGALPENGSAPHAAPGVKWIRRGLPFALEHIKRAGRLARNLSTDEIDRFDPVLPVLPGSMTIYGSSPNAGHLSATTPFGLSLACPEPVEGSKPICTVTTLRQAQGERLSDVYWL